MIEISLIYLDVIAALLTGWCVIFNLDWFLSGKNPYGVYCKWRNINDSRIAVAMILTSLIGGPLGIVWLLIRYSGLAAATFWGSVVFVP